MEKTSHNDAQQQQRRPDVLLGIPPLFVSMSAGDIIPACQRCKRSPDGNPMEAITEACHLVNMLRLLSRKFAWTGATYPEGFIMDQKQQEKEDSLRARITKAREDDEKFADDLETVLHRGQAEWIALCDLEAAGKVPVSEMRKKKRAASRRTIAAIECLMEALTGGVTGAVMWQKIPSTQLGTNSNAVFPTKTILPASMIASLIRFVDSALEQLAKTALQERDWLGFFLKMSSDGNGRLRALIQMEQFLSNADYWQCVRAVWNDCEVTWPDLKAWRYLFTGRTGRQDFMTSDELAQLQGLPDEVVIYRGFSSRYRDGISWTLSRAKAEFFAKYSEGPRRSMACGHFTPGTSKIVTGRCNKVHILALNNERNEQEVIILPEYVEGKGVERWHCEIDEAPAASKVSIEGLD